MEQKTVRIENSDLTARIFGSFDANVRMVEKACLVLDLDIRKSLLKNLWKLYLMARVLLKNMCLLVYLVKCTQ